jgi:beta-N-acetylhexosaminidase
MAHGPLMIDVAGLALAPEDADRLRHPLVGGVILFARNYHSPEQLVALVRSIHDLRTPPLLIAVDHEGGRVQRFRDGFTPVPPMRRLGRLWDRHPQRARSVAQQAGWLFASELRAHGIDFSFAPVLDLDHGNSAVIGDRAFHGQPEAVCELARSLMSGMRTAGMSAVGKHFPGHGYVAADSHHEIPVDGRTLAEIEASDLVPFARLASDGLAAVMPAHVIYPEVDAAPAGFSRVWIADVLRRRLGFEGAVFSDDLAMAGAAVHADVIDRADAALAAGCDMLLLCNDSAAADRLLDGLRYGMPAVGVARLARMRGAAHPPRMEALKAEPRYRDAREALAALADDPPALGGLEPGPGDRGRG